MKLTLNNYFKYAKHMESYLIDDLKAGEETRTDIACLADYARTFHDECLLNAVKNVKGVLAWKYSTNSLKHKIAYARYQFTLARQRSIAKAYVL